MLRFSWYLFAGVLLVSVAACGSSLSRRSAATAIAARIEGPTGSIRVFRHRCVEKNFERYPVVFLEHNQIAGHQRSLERAGLATAFADRPTPEECGTPYLESKEVIAITLTPRGAAEKWPEHNERGGGWDVVTGRRELVGVTHIVNESELARAEFTWRLVPTVGGEALGQIPLEQRASATFQRRADGWHLIRIDNRPPRLREPLSASPGATF